MKRLIFFCILFWYISPMFGQLTIVVDSISDHICPGDSTGYISVHCIGGEPPYSYLWSTDSSTCQIENLTAGFFYLSVVDNLGNSTIDTFNIEFFSLMYSLITHSEMYCVGDSVEIELMLGDGTYPCSFTWSNGLHTQNTIVTCGGTYTVTITDGNYCLKIDSVFINDPDTLFILSSEDQYLIEGDSLILSATASGGVCPYVYYWDGVALSSSINVSPSETTVFDVYFTDSMGCVSDTNSIFVYVLPPIIEFTDTCIFDYTQPIDSFNVSNDVLLSDSLLSLDWSFWQGGIEYIIAGIEYEIDSTGFLAFSIIITCDDEAKEIHVDTFEIIYFIEGGSNIEELLVKNRFLYPNPTNGMISIDEASTIDKVEFYSINGKICKEILKPDSQVDISDLENGIYIVKIHKKNSIKQGKLILNKP